MPVRYVCRECGTVLYEHRKSPMGLLSPREVSVIHRFKCPKCGRKLEPPEPGEWKSKVRVIP